MPAQRNPWCAWQGLTELYRAGQATVPAGALPVEGAEPSLCSRLYGSPNISRKATVCIAPLQGLGVVTPTRRVSSFYQQVKSVQHSQNACAL